jgi:hypothetical protein
MLGEDRDPSRTLIAPCSTAHLRTYASSPALARLALSRGSGHGRVPPSRALPRSRSHDVELGRPPNVRRRTDAVATALAASTGAVAGRARDTARTALSAQRTPYLGRGHRPPLSGARISWHTCPFKGATVIEHPKLLRLWQGRRDGRGPKRNPEGFPS